MIKFRTLKAEEIDVRVGNVYSWGYSLLLYKDSRCDMAILDETVGCENWQRKHYELKDNMYCSVGININYNNDKEPYYIWKDDCGTESFTEKEKGESSDSFKRANVNWGIGRELYTRLNISISGGVEKINDEKAKKEKYILTKDEEKRRFKVIAVEYSDTKEIIAITIVDCKSGEIVFKLGGTPLPKKKEEQPKEETNKVDLVCESCKDIITEKVYNYSKTKFGKPLCYSCQKVVIQTEASRQKEVEV